MQNVRLFDSTMEDAEAQEFEFPAVPLALVEALEKMFPNELPDIHVNDRELGQLIGQVAIVKFLREMSGRRT